MAITIPVCPSYLRFMCSPSYSWFWRNPSNAPTKTLISAVYGNTLSLILATKRYPCLVQKFKKPALYIVLLQFKAAIRACKLYRQFESYRIASLHDLHDGWCAGSIIKEEVYPLCWGDHKVAFDELVDDLLSGSKVEKGDGLSWNPMWG